MATRDEVRDFLLRFRKAAASPHRLVLLRRHPGSKNTECLLELGMTESEAKSEIFRLAIEDYSKGPEADKDREGQEVWIFCRKILKREVYVKIVLTSEGRAKVLSFHFPEFPLQKPLSSVKKEE
jgi:hypothetical protein